MYVNIHSHTDINPNVPCIRNLTFSEANIIFASGIKGLYSVGFHPWYADTFSDELLNTMTEWLKDDRFVAVGECGLDKNSKVSIEEQLMVFDQQIKLSEKIHKPLIIHCVGCFNELFELKKDSIPFRNGLFMVSGASLNSPDRQYGLVADYPSVNISMKKAFASLPSIKYL